MAETHGFMKALVEAKSDRILGFTMLGPEAWEVVACGADRDVGRHALYRTARGYIYPPDDG